MLSSSNVLDSALLSPPPPFYTFLPAPSLQRISLSFFKNLFEILWTTPPVNDQNDQQLANDRLPCSVPTPIPPTSGRPSAHPCTRSFPQVPLDPALAPSSSAPGRPQSTLNSSRATASVPSSSALTLPGEYASPGRHPERAPVSALAEEQQRCRIRIHRRWEERWRRIQSTASRISCAHQLCRPCPRVLAALRFRELTRPPQFLHYLSKIQRNQVIVDKLVDSKSQLQTALHRTSSHRIWMARCASSTSAYRAARTC